jgi:uncharacterized protein (DUF2141 family)
MNIKFQTLKKKALSLRLLLLLLLPAATLNAQDVNVTITGIRSEKGQIVIGVFKDSESYQKEEAFASKSFKKSVNPDGGMKVTFSLEPGVYGLCLLDDEDSNGIMRYNFMKMPKEGFGFSDYYFTGVKKPKFDLFKFTLSKGQQKSIKIRVRYIL